MADPNLPTGGPERERTPDAVPAVAGQLATGRRYVPDVPVTTHRGDEAMFYRDLVYRRTVILNFTSVADDQKYPASLYLERLARRLGDALGRDVFMYSITTDPRRDTPARLARLADGHGAFPGWSFLTGAAAAVDLIRQAFFVHAPPAGGAAAEPERHHATGPADCSLGLLRYGNDIAGLWGSAPVKTDPDLMVQRLSWIRPLAHSNVKPEPRRGGPPRLV